MGLDPGPGAGAAARLALEGCVAGRAGDGAGLETGRCATAAGFALVAPDAAAALAAAAAREGAAVERPPDTAEDAPEFEAAVAAWVEAGAGVGVGVAAAAGAGIPAAPAGMTGGGFSSGAAVGAPGISRAISGSTRPAEDRSLGMTPESAGPGTGDPEAADPVAAASWPACAAVEAGMADAAGEEEATAGPVLAWAGTSESISAPCARRSSGSMGSAWGDCTPEAARAPTGAAA